MQIALIMARPPPSLTSTARKPSLRLASSRATRNKGPGSRLSTLCDEMSARFFCIVPASSRKQPAVEGYFCLQGIEIMFFKFVCFFIQFSVNAAT